MSNSYKKISNLLFNEHKQALNVLLNVFNMYSVMFYLIGAQARDIHLLSKGIKPNRGTRDIDFAVMVDSMEIYKIIKLELLNRGYEETNEPYRLNWEKGETVIDLLPFGKIEQAYTVSFDKRNIELSVLAFKEISEDLSEISFDENNQLSIPLPPLHGIFILKLLAWDIKKPEREKDLIDLIQILENYWYFAEDEAFQNHLDLFNDDFKMINASARILGRQIKLTIKKSDYLKSKVIQILREQTILNEENSSSFINKYAEISNKSMEEIKLILNQILLGIED